jgi:hypothetical protein
MIPKGRNQKIKSSYTIQSKSESWQFDYTLGLENYPFRLNKFLLDPQE